MWRKNNECYFFGSCSVGRGRTWQRANRTFRDSKYCENESSQQHGENTGGSRRVRHNNASCVVSKSSIDRRSRRSTWTLGHAQAAGPPVAPGAPGGVSRCAIPVTHPTSPTHVGVTHLRQSDCPDVETQPLLVVWGCRVAQRDVYVSRRRVNPGGQRLGDTQLWLSRVLVGLLLYHLRLGTDATLNQAVLCTSNLVFDGSRILLTVDQ